MRRASGATEHHGAGAAAGLIVRRRPQAAAERFGFDFTAADNVRRKLHMYVENGFMTADAGRLALTPKGMFVSNYIISSLIPCDREEYAGLRSGTEL